MVTVTVYSKPDCQQCRMTCLALDQAGVRYTVVDVAADDDARRYAAEELGYSTVPVVVVDQDPGRHWAGFRRDRIADLAGHPREP